MSSNTKQLSVINNGIATVANLTINPASAYLLSLRAKSSRKKMSYNLNNIARLVGYTDMNDCDWGAIRRQHVQVIIDLFIEAGREPNTINTNLAAMKGVAYEAWCMELMDTTAYQHIKSIKSVKGERLPKGRCLEASEVKALFKVCDDDDSSKGLRDGAIFGILLGCGLRRGEIVALTMDKINWRDGAIRVVGKGNKERLAFMPDGTARRLEKWIEEVRGDSEGSIITRIRRHDDVTLDPIGDQAIYTILKTRAMQAGFEDVAPHDLRRTFANNLLDNKVEIMTVSKMLGHASVVTTQIYIRIKDEKMKNASQGLVI